MKVVKKRISGMTAEKAVRFIVEHALDSDCAKCEVKNYCKAHKGHYGCLKILYGYLMQDITVQPRFETYSNILDASNDFHNMIVKECDEDCRECSYSDCRDLLTAYSAWLNEEIETEV